MADNNGKFTIQYRGNEYAISVSRESENLKLTFNEGQQKNSIILENALSEDSGDVLEYFEGCLYEYIARKEDALKRPVDISEFFKQYNKLDITTIKRLYHDYIKRSYQEGLGGSIENTLPVSSWVDPTLLSASQREEQTSRFDANIIIQLGHDQTVTQSVANLTSKHADNTVILQWDGKDHNVIGDLAKVKGKVRVRLVGHGSDSINEHATKLAGFSPAEISPDISPDTTIAKVAIKGCGLAMSKENESSFAQDLQIRLQACGLVTPISSYISDIDIGTDGRLRVKVDGQWSDDKAEKQTQKQTLKAAEHELRLYNMHLDVQKRLEKIQASQEKEPKKAEKPSFEYMLARTFYEHVKTQEALYEARKEEEKAARRAEDEARKAEMEARRQQLYAEREQRHLEAAAHCAQVVSVLSALQSNAFTSRATKESSYSSTAAKESPSPQQEQRKNWDTSPAQQSSTLSGLSQHRLNWDTSPDQQSSVLNSLSRHRLNWDTSPAQQSSVLSSLSQHRLNWDTSYQNQQSVLSGLSNHRLQWDLSPAHQHQVLSSLNQLSLEGARFDRALVLA